MVKVLQEPNKTEITRSGSSARSALASDRSTEETYWRALLCGLLLRLNESLRRCKTDTATTHISRFRVGRLSLIFLLYCEICPANILTNEEMFPKYCSYADQSLKLRDDEFFDLVCSLLPMWASLGPNKGAVMWKQEGSSFWVPLLLCGILIRA